MAFSKSSVAPTVMAQLFRRSKQVSPEPYRLEGSKRRALAFAAAASEKRRAVSRSTTPIVVDHGNEFDGRDHPAELRPGRMYVCADCLGDQSRATFRIVL